MKLTYHPAAEAEVVAAARFYERAVSGLGGSFWTSLIAASPGFLLHLTIGG